MTLLALLALLASVLVWASPSSQAQSNAAPDAIGSASGTGVVPHLDGYLANPTGPIGTADTSTDVTVTLNGSLSNDIDGTVELYRWEILTGPYDWITVTPVAGTASNATFPVPSQAFIDSVRDSDPQKYEINAQLTVTDDDGATNTTTVTIYLNQAPTAAITLYAGLRDPSVVADDDTGVKDLYSIPGVIDGPGENGNADNEWDVIGGSFVELAGYTSSDPDNVGGGARSHAWALAAPAAAPTGINGTAAGGPTFLVGALDNTSGDLLADGTTAVPIVQPPGVGNRHTLIYRLTVCDRADTATPPACSTDNPTLAARSTIRVVVHDISAAPELKIGAALTPTSRDRGDVAPQSTVGAITGVENQFIVSAGSTVRLTATVDNTTRSTGAHTFRWSGASQHGANTDTVSMANVRIPGDAEDGDTIDVSVTTINNGSRLSSTTAIQLQVGTNRPPTAEGVPINSGTVDSTVEALAAIPRLSVHSITDGWQNARDGSTVTLRGVATDPDGNPPITSWVLREAKPGQVYDETTFAGTGADLNGDGDSTDTRVDADTALQTLVERWLSATEPAAKAGVAAQVLTAFGSLLADAEEPEEPLVELNGAFTPTVSFEVPNLKSSVPADATATPAVTAVNRNKGTLMYFTVIDSSGVPRVQFIYLLIRADDDAPSADAGSDDQVEAGSFVRLNGSGSSDPDIQDRLRYRWDYIGATMDPLPNQRPPLTDDEIKELTGWVLRRATAAEANEPGLVRDSDGNRYKYIVNSAGKIVSDADVAAGTAGFIPTTGFVSAAAGGKLLGRSSAYPWFDAPEFSGFNDVKLHFRLNVRDSAGTDLTADGDVGDDAAAINEFHVRVDLNEDGALPATAAAATTPATGLVANVKEALLSLDLNNDGDALDTINLGASTCGDGTAACAADETNVSAVDEDEVIVTVARRYFSGNVPSPDFCTNQSLGGPSTYPFDRDGDGVADVCSLNTTRRATVARQNALENLAGVFPSQFRSAVLAVCENTVFKQTDWRLLGDSQDDLDNDACGTTRVSPPPAPVDPAIADVFFSGVITSQDFCTNHSLGGARTYANDIDGDGVADQCSLSTTRREAVARQRALGTFNVSLSSTEQTTLSELRLLVSLEAKMVANGYANNSTNANITDAAAGLTEGEQAEYARIFVKHVGRDGVTVVGFATRLTDPSVANSEQTAVNTQLGALSAKATLAARYSNALLAECRALGSQDFGDAASALARDECNPRPATEVGLPSS